MAVIALGDDGTRRHEPVARRSVSGLSRTVQAVDASAAALIGAGTGSLVALGSQFLNHCLSVVRDRRNHKRDRLFAVIVEAATYLYGLPQEEQSTLDKQEAREPHPESIVGENPELARDLTPFARTTFAGITLLQVHFGRDHWLVDRYVGTAGQCLSAQAKWSEHSRQPDEQMVQEVPEVARAMFDAQLARDQWMREARTEVEKI